MLSYIDDFIVASRPAEADREWARFVAVMEQAGMNLKLEKCHPPAPRQQFLGYEVETAPQVRYCVPAEKRRAIRHEIARLLRCSRPHVRRVAHVAGLCLSVSRAVAPAKFLLRNVYRVVAAAPNWHCCVELDEPARGDLRWWLEGLEGWNGACPLPAPADLTCATDASDVGWGACWLERNETAQGPWTGVMRETPINQRESMAVLNALRIWGSTPAWRGHTVLFQVDNATTVAHLNGFGRLNPALDGIARAIHALAARHGITLQAEHVAGVTNTTADQLSRDFDRSDWMLHPALFRSLDRLWGPHSIDRMATFATRQVPRYESRHRDVQSLRADTFSARWEPGENSWVNPPFSQIHRVLRHLQHSGPGVECTLLAPLWPSQPWWPLLLALTVDWPVLLPQDPRAFRPAASGHSEPTKNLSWRVCAFRISGRPVRPIGAPKVASYLSRLL